MKKVVFIIDGYNIYFALRRCGLDDYKWLDYEKLLGKFVKPDQELSKIIYCTTICPDPEKGERHRIYIQALERTGMVKTVYGTYKERETECPICRRTYKKWTEKKTDVNIAVQLFDGAISDQFDIAILVTGDSDLTPALLVAKKRFSQKKFGLAIPPDRIRGTGSDYPQELVAAASFHVYITPKMIKASLLPKEVMLKSGIQITCPKKWQKYVV